MGKSASIWHMRTRGHVHDNGMHFVTMVHIICTAWADYVNGSVSGIAFLNFESTVVVRCRWFWLEKDEFEHA